MRDQQRAAITETRSIVAVIDDDARVLQSLECLLEAAGHSARTFATAGEFLHYVEESSVDCLISDISMPVISGLDLRRLLRDSRPDLPVILMTGRHELWGVACGDVGALPTFLKPFDSGKLLAAVGAALLARHPDADPHSH